MAQSLFKFDKMNHRIRTIAAKALSEEATFGSACVVRFLFRSPKPVNENLIDRWMKNNQVFRAQRNIKQLLIELQFAGIVEPTAKGYQITVNMKDLIAEVASEKFFQ